MVWAGAWVVVSMEEVWGGGGQQWILRTQEKGTVF